MRIQAQSSLATRQAKAVFIISVVLGLCFSLFQIMLDLHQEQDRIQRYFEGKLEQSYINATQAAYQINEKLAQQVVVNLLADPTIVRAEVTDDFGDVLASGSQPPEKQNWVTEQITHYLFREEADFTTELRTQRKTEPVGLLTFSVDGAITAQNFLNRSGSLLIFDFIRNVLLASILLIFFYNKISKPVVDLTLWVRSLKSTGSTDNQQPNLSNDELGQLAHSFLTLWQERENATEQLNRNVVALSKSENFSRTIMDNSGDALLIINRSGAIVHANKQAYQSLDYQANDLSQADASIICSRYTVAEFDRQLKQQPDQAITTFEASHQRRDGSRFPVEVTAIEVDLDNQPLILLQARDITSRKQAEKQIHDLAYYDTLTGLSNRRMLLDSLSETICETRNRQQTGALLFLDLDRFKTINDSLGHTVGDQLLCAVAQRLKNCINPSSMAARLGGDEFVVLLPNIRSDDSQLGSPATEMAQRILQSMATPYQIGHHQLYCTVSIGITTFPSAHTDSVEVLRQADTALYRAKAKGRNTFMYYEPEMQALAESRLLIEKGLHNALHRNELELYYQPQINNQGEIIGAEALIRWRHPEKGLLPPGAFMSVAEETGQILQIGDWVIEQALHQLSSWQEQQLLPASFERLAINVSPLQFAQSNFVDRLTELLEKTAVNGKFVELEITENMLLENIDAASHKMKQLKKLDLAIAIDDFGTGYSSLRYLKHLSLDVLKIDRSFVTQLHLDSSDTAIVDAIILMAERLGLKVIAEGVEDFQEFRALEGLGCMRYQGYYFDKPLSHAEISDRLRQSPYPSKLHKASETIHSLSS